MRALLGRTAEVAFAAAAVGAVIVGSLLLWEWLTGPDRDATCTGTRGYEVCADDDVGGGDGWLEWDTRPLDHQLDERPVPTPTFTQSWRDD